MKFVPKPCESDENVNISHVSEWWYGIRIFINVSMAAFVIYIFLGLIVDLVMPHIPAAWEDKLARPILAKAASTVETTKKYNTPRINSLLQRLAALDDSIKDRNFSLEVVKSSQSNALALPGGHIIIYSPLLEEVESENELAMILAHELGHFAARDHLRGLGRSFLFFIITAGLTGISSNSSQVLFNSSGLMKNTYSRSQEIAADKFALDLLVKHYGHAGGATDFFNRLSKKETLPQLSQYLSTHPASYARANMLNNLIESNGYEIRKVEPIFWEKAPRPETE